MAIARLAMRLQEGEGRSELQAHEMAGKLAHPHKRRAVGPAVRARVAQGHGQARQDPCLVPVGRAPWGNETRQAQV